MHSLQTNDADEARRTMAWKATRKGNYCYIDLFGEDFEESEWEHEERELQHEPENLVNENEDDDPVREEDAEDEKAEKFPVELRNDEEEDGSDTEVNKVQQYVEEELKEHKVEECLICEDHSPCSDTLPQLCYFVWNACKSITFIASWRRMVGMLVSFIIAVSCNNNEFIPNDSQLVCLSFVVCQQLILGHIIQSYVKVIGTSTPLHDLFLHAILYLC